MAFLCVDIGATNTVIGTGKQDFETVEKYSTRYFFENTDELVEAVVRESSHELEDLEHVAVAAAGPIDRAKGEFYPPNLSKESFNLREMLSGYGDVKMMNDATAAVAGEYYYGRNSAEDMIYLTISSGIGAGVIVDGEILEGWGGNLGEVGHMEIGKDGVKCGCGGCDHWEAYSAGDRMPLMAEQLFNRNYKDSREIFEKQEIGDRTAEKVIDKMQECNARGFENLINLFNPEVIWVGGAVAQNHFEKVVEEPFEKVEDGLMNQEPIVEENSLGEEAVVHGLKAACKGEFEL
ncbi:MAG: ROK family protein [Nanohaloarchaea archaeon]|nr:ROK family protein [Candidatus Nanohaloarchaea archaeon]